MSVEIQVIQKPLAITPSNTEHIWTLASTGYTQTDFKFVMDIYFSPNNYNQKKARLLARPNDFGRAIFNIQDVVRNFLEVNPRALLAVADGYYPTGYTPSIENRIVTLASAEICYGYNAFNQFYSDAIDDLWHIEEYGVKIGCVYTSGTTTIEDIDLEAAWQPEPILIFPGVDNEIIPKPALLYATLGSGYTGSNIFYDETTQNHYYYNLFRHVYSGTTQDDCQPAEFLNACGKELFTTQGITRVRRRYHHRDCPIIVSFLNGKNPLFTNDIYSLGVLGAASQTGPYTSSGETRNRNSSTIPTVNETVDNQFRLSTFYLPYNVTFGPTLYAIPTTSKKVAFFGTTYNASDSVRLNPANKTTELLEFYFQEDDCLNTPKHFLFLNGRGMWDTITLDKKSEKVINLDRSTYFQGISLNRSEYARGSYNRGKRVYEQNANYEVLATSWFIYENDMVIYEELFMSPEIYIIEGTTLDDSDCNDCLGIVHLYQNLIPVVMKDKSFKEYNKNYQKLFQYSFTFEYGGLKRFRTQG
jgi:hypothetical protein